MQRTWRVGVLAGAMLGACSTTRENSAAPNYRDDIAPLFAAKCAACHGTEGGYSVSSYLAAIGCGVSGRPANAASDAPILRALARPPHLGVLASDERSLVERWLAAGAPAFARGVHDPAFVDPRAEGSHARFLRARSWKPMLDGKDPDACGRCHDGAPARPEAARLAAPGATDCTTCHAETKGALACTTCHGSKGKAYPPRDACFHPEALADTSHPAHARFACSSCHPVATDLSGTHGDGHTEVWFDQKLAGVGARFSGGSCTTSCHAGPGAKRPKPSWSEPSPMVCGDCHAAPPAGHYAGACASCHGSGPLHVNGRVDLGDGSGKCGACHGTGDDPLPKTGAHAIHASPKSAQPVACTTCHELPSGKHPLGTGRASVRLSGLAAKGGVAPTYDASTQTCANVYCHALGGGTAPKPAWTATLPTCGGCHALPPPAPHASSASCGTTGCHEGKVEGGLLTKDGIAHHVNGSIELR